MIRFQENEELMFLGHDNVSLRKMAYDAYGKVFELNEGKFLDSDLHLLTYKKFDNLLLGFIYTSGHLDGRYKELKEQLKKIIAIIDSQIK